MFELTDFSWLVITCVSFVVGLGLGVLLAQIEGCDTCDTHNPDDENFGR